MRTALLILTCCIFFGCRSKDKIPSNVLKEEKMEAVLWDLMRADQFLMDYVFSKDTSVNKDQKSIELYQRIFSIHQVSKEEFQQSLTYYRSRPELFKVMMDSLSKRPLTDAKPVSPTTDTTRPRITQPVKTD